MALTTEWPGSGLPAGWAAFTPAGSSVAVADGWLQLTAAGGTAYDGISASNGVSTAIAAYHAAPNPGGAFSWAIQVSTDVGDTKSWGVYLAACDVDGEDNSGGGWARYGISRPNTNDERPNRFAGSRPAGSGTGSGGQNHYNTHVNNAPLGLQSGMPSFLRLDFDGVQTWQPYVSTDGHTWIADTPFTRAIDPTRLLILFTSTTPQTAGSVRIAGSWDLLDLGTTDLRQALPPVDRVTVSTFDGTAAELPDGWIDDSAGGDAVTFTGTAVRLSSDAANVESRARIRWDGDRFASCGLLLRVHWPSFDSDLYNTWALTTDEGSSQDPYLRVGGGYGLERGGTAIRPIRVDNPLGSNVASVAGSTGLDEKPYAWLRNATGSNIGTGAPTLMFRLERQVAGPGGHARYRVKSWADAGSLAASLAAEPSTWDIIDAQDDIERDPLGPLLVLAHNNPVGGLTGTGQQELLYVEYYRLVEPVDLGVAVGLAAAGTAPATGIGALDLDVDLAAAGHAARSGSAGLGVALALAAVGETPAISAGTADLGVAVGLAAAGTTGQAGSATFPIHLELAAQGPPRTGRLTFDSRARPAVDMEARS